LGEEQFWWGAAAIVRSLERLKNAHKLCTSTPKSMPNKEKEPHL